MQSKPLSIPISVEAESVLEAVMQLSGLYLRSNTRSGAKIVNETTEYNVGDLCKRLIDDWQSGRATYCPGEITLLFSDGKLAIEADLVNYKGKNGSRLVYSKPPGKTSRSRKSATSDDELAQIARQLTTLSAGLSDLTDWQRALDSRLQDVFSQTFAVDISSTVPSPQGTPATEFQQALNQALKLHADAVARQIQASFSAQSEKFAELLSHKLEQTSKQFSDRLEKIQSQLNDLSMQVKALQEPIDPEAELPPKTEAEWLRRFQDSWGTVGDYEQYSYSFREANAETPLCPTPDWVALCELDWARKISPTLALLYDLIHAESGIGYTGADILQQFGQHIDPISGKRFYIYHQRGFSAYDALWQTANHPQYPWLSQLQRLARLSKRYQAVFEMFGWEAEAITSLESVVERTLYERQGRDRHSPPHARQATNPLSGYLDLLNIGPFTPITPETLKRAYRQAMKAAHPDIGGSTEMAQKINAAYEALLAHYFPQAT